MVAGASSGERSSARRAAVHTVSEEEAASGCYSIEDVVLPLPGGQVQYPAYGLVEDTDDGAQVRLPYMVLGLLVSDTSRHGHVACADMIMSHEHVTCHMIMLAKDT